MLRKAFPEATEVEAFAWRAFLADATSKDPFLLKERRPETSTTNRGSAKPKNDKKKSEVGKDSSKTSTVGIDKGAESSDERQDHYRNNAASQMEIAAVITIQRYFKAYYTKRIFSARIPGSPQNLEVCETLKKSLNVIEQNIHENALLLFRYVIFNLMFF